MRRIGPPLPGAAAPAPVQCGDRGAHVVLTHGPGVVHALFGQQAKKAPATLDASDVDVGHQTDDVRRAVRMYQEMFRFRNFGAATTMAVILLVAVIPIMVVNIRNLRRQGVGA